jgi:protein TonB
VSNERAEQLAAVDAQGALPGSPQTVPPETLAAADAGPIVGAGLSPEEEAAMAGDADAAATSLSDWFNAGGAVAGLANTPATAAIKPVPLGDTAATPISGEQAVAATGTGAPASPQSPAAAPTAETTASSTVSGPSAGSVTVTEAPRVQAAMPVVPTRPQNGVVPAPAPALSSQPRWIKGGPKDSDNRRGQYQGDVLVQFTVQPNGRVSNCGTFRSSGNPQLDAMTCRVVTDRARFVPARDVRGRPVPTRVSVSYHWGKGPRQKR